MASSDSAKAACRAGWTRQAYLFDDFFIADAVPLVYQHRLGNPYAEAFQVLVGYELVECQCRNQYIAGGIRDSEQFKITLQDAVLARSAVDGDVGEIGLYLLPVLHEGEVVLVYRALRAVFQQGVPAFAS